MLHLFSRDESGMIKPCLDRSEIVFSVKWFSEDLTGTWSSEPAKAGHWEFSGQEQTQQDSARTVSQ